MWKEEGVTQEFRELFFQSTISVSKNISDNFFLERNTRLISPYQCVINCFISPGSILTFPMQLLSTLILPWSNKKRTFSDVIVKKNTTIRNLTGCYSFKYLAKAELED